MPVANCRAYLNKYAGFNKIIRKIKVGTYFMLIYTEIRYYTFASIRKVNKTLINKSGT